MEDEKTLMRFKVPELKQQLFALGIVPKGLKSDLVKQLCAALREQQEQANASTVVTETIAENEQQFYNNDEIIVQTEVVPPHQEHQQEDYVNNYQQEIVQETVEQVEIQNFQQEEVVVEQIEEQNYQQEEIAPETVEQVETQNFQQEEEVVELIEEANYQQEEIVQDTAMQVETQNYQQEAVEESIDLAQVGQQQFFDNTEYQEASNDSEVVLQTQEENVINKETAISDFVRQNSDNAVDSSDVYPNSESQDTPQTYQETSNFSYPEDSGEVSNEEIQHEAIPEHNEFVENQELIADEPQTVEEYSQDQHLQQNSNDNDDDCENLTSASESRDVSQTFEDNSNFENANSTDQDSASFYVQLPTYEESSNPTTNDQATNDSELDMPETAEEHTDVSDQVHYETQQINLNYQDYISNQAEEDDKDSVDESQFVNESAQNLISEEELAKMTKNQRRKYKKKMRNKIKRLERNQIDLKRRKLNAENKVKRERSETVEVKIEEPEEPEDEDRMDIDEEDEPEEERERKKQLEEQKRKQMQQQHREQQRLKVESHKENLDGNIEIEYIPEDMPKDSVYLQFIKVFDKFSAVSADEARRIEEERLFEQNKNRDERTKLLDLKKPVELELKDDEDNVDGVNKLSKRKMKQMARMSIADLKQRVSHPELVEMHDITARDPTLLLFLKSTRNTVPIPRHWCYKRKYLQGKRGFEKPPFKLPEFIRKTGIQEMREAVQEKEDSKNLKNKMREKIRPKMGKIDIDYQKLHDAFFKWQTKPKLTIHGDLYYEGKEFETRLKDKKPGELSGELRAALGMPTGPSAQKCPPPWLIAMQRYGPPPSYPNLKIAGLNAPIPEGCSFGYHAGGWGKPPVDEYGRPLYGDVFGITAAGNDLSMLEEEVDRSKWGELESEEESEAEEEEEEEEAGEANIDDSGLVTPAAEGLVTPSGMSTGLPSGMETPDMVELRKRKQIEAEMESGENPQLFTVIPEKKTDKYGKDMMGSMHVYDFASLSKTKPSSSSSAPSGVQVALDPSELEAGALDTNQMAAKYEQTMREQQNNPHEDLSDMVAEYASRQKRKNKQDSGKSKKYQFKF